MIRFYRLKPRSFFFSSPFEIPTEINKQRQVCRNRYNPQRARARVRNRKLLPNSNTARPKKVLRKGPSGYWKVVRSFRPRPCIRDYLGTIFLQTAPVPGHKNLGMHLPVPLLQHFHATGRGREREREKTGLIWVAGDEKILVNIIFRESLWKARFSLSLFFFFSCGHLSHGYLESRSICSRFVYLDRRPCFTAHPFTFRKNFFCLLFIFTRSLFGELRTAVYLIVEVKIC